MSALDKYHIIQAETLEAVEHYRALIKARLATSDLPSDFRAELEGALQRNDERELALLKAADEDEETHKKKKGDGGEEGKSGGDQQGGTGTGSGAAGDGDMGSGSSGENDDEDLSPMEEFALLLFLAEKDSCQHAEASAAATLSFNRNEGVAQVDEPYTLDHENHAHAPSDFVPSLERHVTGIGARILQLKVHPDAVELFRKKLGYAPYGKLLKRGGAPVQRMRKSLPARALLRNDLTN